MGSSPTSPLAATTGSSLSISGTAEEGSQRAWEDPQIQGAREAAGRNGGSTGETTFEHYEVEEYRQGGG